MEPRHFSRSRPNKLVLSALTKKNAFSFDSRTLALHQAEIVDAD
jgi:hypothetical protein